MDDSSIRELKAALSATPDNMPLLKVMLRAYLERGEPDEAVAAIRDRTVDDFDNEDGLRLAAEVYLAASEAEKALEFAQGESAETLLVKAKALLALERNEEGARAYRSAVAKNAALEDPALHSRLSAKVTEFPSRGQGPRLKVIANDDTDAMEVDRFLMPDEETVTFADVGGLEHVKKTIHKKIILPYQKPTLFQRFKKRVGGGILMYGPPGCGKTLLARATAGECNAAFFNVAISDVLDMYTGESERKLHALFEKARQSVPAVLFFDEVEALGGKRQYSREATSSKLVSQFLSEMDGFAQDNHGVLILAATNVPWAVDAAFRRPGRFDRVLFVPPPDRDARTAILNLLLAERPVAKRMELDGLARRTGGYSGADLRELVEAAVDVAIEASLETGCERALLDDDLNAALKEVRPTTLEWLTTARNYARYANEGGQYDEVLAFLKRHGKS